MGFDEHLCGSDKEPGSQWIGTRTKFVNQSVTTTKPSAAQQLATEG